MDYNDCNDRLEFVLLFSATFITSGIQDNFQHEVPYNWKCVYFWVKTISQQQNQKEIFKL